MAVIPIFILLGIFSATLADIEPNGREYALNAIGLIQDRFRIIQSNLNESYLTDVIDDFTAYKCEKMAVIRNRAKSDIRVSCQSEDETAKTQNVKPGNAYIFSFRPRKSGKSIFWCTVEYTQQFARFDVYNENSPYMCPRELDEVYQYTVYHDGVYADGTKDGGSTKIRALFKGHNKFILWEEFVDNETDGFLMSGLVDGGMCADIPDIFNDKPAAVTVCYHHCIHLYEHLGCRGKVQVIQAPNDCVDTVIKPELIGKLSAIKGC